MAEIDIASLLDDPRATIGAIAIAGSAAGTDIRDDPEFEALESEFRKMETAGPTAVNWKLLNGQTVEVIEKKSKDLVLGSRLAYGLFREEGYKGLAVGISVLNGMVASHWEGLFPPLKRERGRAGSFDWLAEKLAPVIEAQPPPAAGEAEVFALVAHDRLVELDEQLSAKMQKFPVALGPLIRALRPHARQARAALEAKAEAEKPSAEPAAAQPVPAEAASTPPNGATAPQAEQPPPQPTPPASQSSSSGAPVVVAPEVQTGEGTEKSLQSIFSAAGRVAAYVRQEAPADPRGYLCARLAIWGQIKSPPPDNAGKSALPPPPKTRLSELQAMRAAGNHQGLLMSAEGAFVTSPFWLDAQYVVAQSMQALGAAYEAARAAVIGELGAFLRRLPGLTALSFSDGMPFADGETLAWIDSEVRSGGGDAGAGSELDKKKSAAGQLAQSGQVLAGLKLLTDFAESRFGERERFLARLEIGEYCLRFELLQPLLSLLAALRQTAALRALDAWEPQLAVALASLSWRALIHKNAKRFLDEKEALEERARIMATLAELDIVTAARLSSTQLA